MFIVSEDIDRYTTFIMKKLILHIKKGIGDNLLTMYDIHHKYQHMYNEIYIVDSLGDYIQEFERYFKFKVSYIKDYHAIPESILNISKNVHYDSEIVYIDGEYDSTIFNYMHTKNVQNISMKNILPSIVNITDICIPDSILQAYENDNQLYNLTDRTGVHLRFRSNKLMVNYNLPSIIRTIRNSVKDKKLLVIYDNVDFYNSFSYIFKNNDIFTLKNIIRANNKDEDLGNYYTSTWKDILYDAIKEAYYIAKCKKFYTQDTSLFGNLVIPLIKSCVNK